MLAAIEEVPWRRFLFQTPVGRHPDRMLRVMLDSNIFDQIIDTPDLVDHLRSLTASGRLDIVVTHVQEDELARIQDAEKSRAIQQVPRRSVPTAVFVPGTSRLGQARLGEGHEGGLEYDTLHAENPRRVPDAVIALTAAAEAEDVEAFVTEDARLARNVSAKAKTLKVWGFTEFSFVCPDCWGASCKRSSGTGASTALGSDHRYRCGASSHRVVTGLVGRRDD